jgi:hypothetical protein
MEQAAAVYKSPSNPDGLPAWKVSTCRRALSNCVSWLILSDAPQHIVMWFFPATGKSPVGNEWHISAEPAPAHWSESWACKTWIVGR